jgi:predicted nucleotidyltransferase component of viral defense system
MTRKGPKRNLAASIRARLSQLARDRHEDFQFVLTRYAMERLLYRLSKSRHEPSFVLKGAMLFTVWSGHPHRATQDLDLLGFGAPDLDRLAQTFRDISLVRVEDDGVVFDPESVTASRIKEAAQYEGVRVLLRGALGAAVLNLQVDIGFGDAITPGPVAAEFPVLLDAPTPKLRVYPRDTVVAEKLEAMVQLGIANSRMKDFFDLRFLARSFEFDGIVLADAIRATFARRGTPVPEAAPVALTAAFTEDAQKKVQWTAFLKRIGAADQALTLAAIVAEIDAFVTPPLDAIRNETSFQRTWAQGRWR